MTVAAESEAHADFARDGAHRAARDAEQADLLNVVGMPEPVLFFRKFLCAASSAEDDSDLAFLIHRHRGGIEAGVLDGFARRGDSERHDTGNVLAFTSINPGKLIKFGDLAGDVHRQFRWIETRNAFYSGFSRENGAAKSFLADAIRADHAHAGDNYASSHRSVISGIIV